MFKNKFVPENLSMYLYICMYVRTLLIYTFFQANFTYFMIPYLRPQNLMKMLPFVYIFLSI